MFEKIKKLIAANWRRQSVIIITVACFLINVFALTLYIKNEEINESKNWVIHSYEVLRQSRLVLIDVQEMQIGQRGYLLSGRGEYLLPYEGARTSIMVEAGKLRDLVADNLNQVQRVDDIITDLKSHEILLNDQIKRFQSKKYTITIRDLDQSAALLAQIKSKIDAMQEDERHLLAVREKIEKRKRTNYIDTIVLGSLLAVLGLILANGFIIYQSERRRKTEADLKRSEEIYTLVTQGINEGIYEYDIGNNEIYFSKGYKQMLGYKGNEFPDTVETLNEHIHPEDFKETWDNVHKFTTGDGESYRNFFRMRHKDGHYIWVMSRGVGLYGPDGKMQKIIGTHTDITEQKESEEYLTQLNAELENFTYVTSHDLRSPLVNLKGFSVEMQYSLDELKNEIKKLLPKAAAKKTAIINRIVEKDLPEAVGYIKNSVERLDQLTSAILDLSRIGRRELKIEHINTTEMVKKILDTMAYEINNKKVEIKIGELPDVNSDRVSMQQVFSNILENAIKYLDDARPGIISIKGTEFPGETQFMVSDNGRGISEADKPRVFDMFKRARNVTEVRGAGMGMSFVKATIQRLGGKIWFESTLGQGTKFIFTIPLRTRRDHE